LLHEALASGLLNSDYNGGVGAHAPWEPHMMNTFPVLDLLVSRMQSDHENQAPKWRKPFGAKDIEAQQFVF